MGVDCDRLYRSLVDLQAKTGSHIASLEMRLPILLPFEITPALYPHVRIWDPFHTKAPMRNVYLLVGWPT